MTEYIDKKKLKALLLFMISHKWIEDSNDTLDFVAIPPEYSSKEKFSFDEIERIIDGSETINVVRCKDCKCYEDNEHYPMCKVLGREVEPDWFCADGKEKKND